MDFEVNQAGEWLGIHNAKLINRTWLGLAICVRAAIPGWNACHTIPTVTKVLKPWEVDDRTISGVPRVPLTRIYESGANITVHSLDLDAAWYWIDTMVLGDMHRVHHPFDFIWPPVQWSRTLTMFSCGWVYGDNYDVNRLMRKHWKDPKSCPWQRIPFLKIQTYPDFKLFTFVSKIIVGNQVIRFASIDFF